MRFSNTNLILFVMNKFCYVSDIDAIEKNNSAITNYQNDSYDLIDESDLEEDKYIKIPLFNPELDFFENFSDGKKYILIPIDGNEFGYYENRRFLAPGTKVISGFKNFQLLEETEMFHHIIDYASMFGVRLNRFMNYNPDFFSCDERVFFESLIMKYRYFHFKPFFLSYPTITKEIGIKKDRAVSINKRFVELGILETQIKGSMIDSGPSQVTYYSLDTKRILELFPQIYLDADTESDVEHDIKKYLLGEYQ